MCGLPIIAIDDFQGATLQKLMDHIWQSQKCKVGDIKIRDLSNTAEYPYGVYLFFSTESDQEKDCLYVGKVSSRSYAERIPMHFDPRKDAWMNQFARYFSEQVFQNDYEKALLHALNQYIIFIGFRFRESNPEYKNLKAEDKRAFDKKFAQPINALETVLRSVMEPKLNKADKPFVRSDDLFSLISYESRATT